MYLPFINNPKDLLCGVIDLLFPPLCVGCNNKLIQGETFICTCCFFSFPQTDYHKTVENPIIYRLIGKSNITYGWALYILRKHSPLEQTLFTMKYKNQPKIGKILGQRYGTILSQIPSIQEIEGIVPVPLHYTKLRKRGYNQSAFFAQGLSEILQIPIYPTCIERNQNTPSQTQKNKEERIKNLQSAFSATNPLPIAHKHLLLVDDILTTGATLAACTNVLLAAGARAISVAVIAIAEEK